MHPNIHAVSVSNSNSMAESIKYVSAVIVSQTSMLDLRSDELLHRQIKTYPHAQNNKNDTVFTQYFIGLLRYVAVISCHRTSYHLRRHFLKCFYLCAWRAGQQRCRRTHQGHSLQPSQTAQTAVCHFSETHAHKIECTKIKVSS